MTGRCLYSNEFGSRTGAPGEIFMQWKGIDLCADFRCECGSGEHICDTSFVYRIKCGDCGAIYEMPHTLPLRKVDSDDGTPTYETDKSEDR